MADPNATTCAACGTRGDLHEHYLVPRILGGAGLPTVWLCVPCRGLVFAANHRMLTLAGLARAREQGKRLGNPNGNQPLHLRGLGNDAAVAGIKARADRHAAQVLPVIVAIRGEGILSNKGIAAELNRRGILTARGGKWYGTTVRNLLTRSPAG